MTQKHTKLVSRFNQSSKWIVGIVGILILFSILILILGNFPKKADINYNNQPYVGKESAPVQVVEFGDYKCPACKEFNRSLLPEIKEKLIDTGEVKFYFINYSFINKDSVRAAKFAETVYEELGNKTFWEFHDLLYKSQPNNPKAETEDIYTTDFLVKNLKKITNEKNTSKVLSAFKHHKSNELWNEDMNQVKDLSVTGTPTLFIDGNEFQGNTFKEFKSMVNAAKEERKSRNE